MMLKEMAFGIYRRSILADLVHRLHTYKPTSEN